MLTLACLNDFFLAQDATQSAAWIANLRYIAGGVVTPPGWREAYKALIEAGWNGLLQRRLADLADVLGPAVHTGLLVGRGINAEAELGRDHHPVAHRLSAPRRPSPRW